MHTRQWTVIFFIINLYSTRIRRDKFYASILVPGGHFKANNAQKVTKCLQIRNTLIHMQKVSRLKSVLVLK